MEVAPLRQQLTFTSTCLVLLTFFLAGLKVLYKTGKMEPTSKTHANGNSSSQQGASFLSALGQPMCPARHLYIVVVYLDGV